eukprot:4422101-Lingulodinium_polyedra.AAC.1
MDPVQRTAASQGEEGSREGLTGGDGTAAPVRVAETPGGAACGPGQDAPGGEAGAADCPSGPRTGERSSPMLGKKERKGEGRKKE